MNIDTLVDQGQLQAAIASLTEELRSHPLNFRRRTYLFGLLCFAGEYARAEQQLAVLSQENAQTATASEFYRQLLQATVERERLFMPETAESDPDRLREPAFLFGRPDYAELYIAALAALRKGDEVQACECYQEAERRRPRRAARLDDTTVADLRDADDRMAAFVELFVEGRYSWFALEQVLSLQISKPKQLWDLVWTPIRIVHPGGTIAGYMPALYPGTAADADGSVQLGHRTIWQPASTGLPVPLAIGRGLRLFTDGSSDFAFLDYRAITFGEQLIASPEVGAADAERHGFAPLQEERQLL